MQWNPYLRSAKFLILRWSFQGGLRSGFHCMLHPCINRYVIYMKTELTGFPGGPMGPGSPGVPSGPGNPGSPDFPSLPSLPGSPCRQNHNLFLCSKLFRNFYDVPNVQPITTQQSLRTPGGWFIDWLIDWLYQSLRHINTKRVIQCQNRRVH